MTAVGIVPARYASSRFPGKPLAKIAGVPMIQHVVEGARAATQLRDVLVATDDTRIADACRAFGASVVMTAADHPSGTDRLAEAVAGLDDDIVVNIQGDEPLVEGFVIDAAVAALREGDAEMSTLVHSAPPEALGDPNRVKVVLDQRGHALYFSRAPIPHSPGGEALAGRPTPPRWQHIGLYAYQRDFLERWPSLPPTPLEQSERLEQLRALEHGYRIRVGVIEGWQSVPVDVPADLAAVEVLMASRDRQRG